MSKLRSHPKAFTLIELLVVISIIALLVGILLPVLRNARQSARELLCMTQMRNYGQAIYAYQADEGTAPQISTEYTGGSQGFRGSVWMQTLQEKGYISAEDNSVVQRCPIVAQDLQSWLAIRGRDEANPIFSYVMNAHLGGWDAAILATNPSQSYTPQPLSTDDVPNASKTAMVAERFFMEDYSVNGGKSQVAARSWSDTGIPHIEKTFNVSHTLGSGSGAIEVPGREGTANMVFVDGSASAQSGRHGYNAGARNMRSDGTDWEDLDLQLDFREDDDAMD